MRYKRTSRGGFTLTEMMVATALILFIMAIISTAFRSGIDTFSKLNTVGKLQEQLTNSTRLIQRDLSAEHFDGANTRLSQQRLDQPIWSKPTAGYFAAWQVNQTTLESTATDGEGLGSSYNISSVMRFTVKLDSVSVPPLQRFPLFTTITGDLKDLPPSVIDPSGTKRYYASRWAEVEYFLSNTGLRTSSDPVTGTDLPLFSLRRKMTILADTPSPSTSPHAPYANAPTVMDTSATKVPHVMQPLPSGDDILLTNVTNFEVKFIWTGPNPATMGLEKAVLLPNSSTPHPTATPTSAMYAALSSNAADSADWPYSDLPLDAYRTSGKRTGWEAAVPGRRDGYQSPIGNQLLRYFDTSYLDDRFPRDGMAPVDDLIIPPMMMTPAMPNPNATLPAQPPLRIRIMAIQFKIRIYDEKTGQSRQVTITQEV